MSEVIGHQIGSSAKVNQLIKDLVAQVQGLSDKISGVRSPDPEMNTHFAQMLDEVSKTRGRPLYYPYIGSGLGRGPYVELEDGSVKLDLINGIGIHLFGHSHPRVIAAAVRGALSDAVMQGNLQPNTEYLKFSKQLVEIAGKNSRLKYCWFATCGTMANENALKMVRQKNSPARKLISMTGAFAGRSTMMAEVTDNPAYKQGLPEYNEVLRLDYPKWSSLKVFDRATADKGLATVKEHVAKHPKNIAAFAFEPMLGEGGYHVANKQFFAPILEFLKSQNIAIWADEVQTFTRTGEFFAFETLEIGSFIDVCTIAKTAQVGATFYTEEYNPKPGLIAGTFSGSTASMTAGMEIISILKNEGYLGPNGRIAKIHQNFVGMLNRLNDSTCKGLLRDAGGLGLMIAVTPLDGSQDKINNLLKVLFKNGLLTYSCGRDPYRVRFLVPATMEDRDIEVAGKIIEKSILELA